MRPPAALALFITCLVPCFEAAAQAPIAVQVQPANPIEYQSVALSIDLHGACNTVTGISQLDAATVIVNTASLVCPATPPTFFPLVATVGRLVAGPHVVILRHNGETRGNVALTVSPVALSVSPESPTLSDTLFVTVGIPQCEVASSNFLMIGAILSLTLKPCAGGSTEPFRTNLQIVLLGAYSLRLLVDGTPMAGTVAFTMSLPPPVFALGITPTSPVEYVPVSLRLLAPCFRLEGVTRPDAHLFVVTVELLSCPTTPSSVQDLVNLGYLSAGAYRIVLMVKGDPKVRGAANFGVAKGAAKLDYSDFWEVTGGPGWGLTLKQHDFDRMLVVIYAYRADGGPLWLAMTGGEWESPTRISGAIFRASGPAPGIAGVSSNRQVGRLRIDFDTPQSATVTFTREGTDPDLPATKTWRIGRLAF